MSRIEIKSETPITLAEVKSKLEEVKKRDKDLTPRATKTYEYANEFGKMKEKDAIALREKIMGLNIPRLKPRQVTKLIDLHPKDADSIRMILTGENITLKAEDTEKLIEVLK